MISVIITNYNKELYIEDTLNSLFQQLEKNFELIFFDDNSTDNSLNLTKLFFKKNKFKKIKTKEDYELWLNFLKSGYKIRTLNYFCTFYRVRVSTLSSFHLNKMINAYRIYYSSLKFSFHYSIYCVIRLYFNAFLKKYTNYE